MSNYKKVTLADDPRVELHDSLGLTGAEISVNHLPAGAGVPFVHAHRNNEEIYAVLSGRGRAVIDGDTVALAAGDWLRIAPAAKRQFFAAEDCAIRFLCIHSNHQNWRHTAGRGALAAGKAAVQMGVDNFDGCYRSGKAPWGPTPGRTPLCKVGRALPSPTKRSRTVFSVRLLPFGAV